MTNGDRQCPICGLGHTVIQNDSRGRDALEIDCKRCGKFVLDRLLRVNIRTMTDENDKLLLSYLPAYTRQKYEQGTIGEIDRDNWRDFARAHQVTPVSRKVTKLLELIAARSSRPGDEVGIDYDLDYPLLDARSADEVLFLFEHLIAIGDIQSRGYINQGTQHTAIVTIQGWERLGPPRGGSGIPGRCFIAMSFDPSLNDAYELGIRPAVTDCGCDPIRIDRVHHNEKICDRILAEIRRAQFVVADFTNHRGGVYFEAGFGMALGRPVIWMCHENDLKNTHFDTRQYSHIVWSTPQDLRAKLIDRIRATILR